ncbi:TonB-dependent receptor domain-containing protein [Novosphingobium sp. Gsoil 351]|uniref:TonB-dependent receptor domain-containing protein n=1 Tax=Novosphingobium sp. Gsoil 351 TaxID=2675225 RepID=UPI0012B487A0|nr:TonB-dependent receptor [Novosphingobium sp. Gsoil 351]QGN55699.1 TonB-dependent receptor [Novosphingobium sp. Gsoil 351]
MSHNCIRTRLSQGSAVLAIILATTATAHAQEVAPADQPAADAVLTAGEAPESAADGADQGAASAEGSGGSDIVVTGTRIGASGFNAPTPVTVATSEKLKEAAPGNLADGLNQLPVFAGSIKSSNSLPTAANRNIGQNLLNLRGLGPTRTLVLLNGQRMVANNVLGSVDINVIPQGLVSRVDVVTGGASAAYGSDAVAGVVNFVLNTGLRGFKGELQSGISTFGDARQFSGSLAYGASTSDDTARFIVGIDAFDQKGIGPLKKTGRDFFDNGEGTIVIPNGTPRQFNARQVRSGQATYGGLITSGPLVGTQFLGNGATSAFNYGSPGASNYTWINGGDGAKGNLGLLPGQKRFSGYVRAEFDVNDRLTVYADGLYAQSHTDQAAFYNYATTALAQYTIFRDNAYLPAAVAARMDAAGITSFKLGRAESELPLDHNVAKTDVYRASVGLRGSFGDSWKYDAGYTFGQTDQFMANTNLAVARNAFAAADAVRDASGKIVCRSTLSGLDPGCTPRNLFGVQPVDKAISDYVTDDSFLNLRLRQQVFSANIRGNLGDSFQIAGPIAVAAGLEYRKESAFQTVDALSPTKNDFTGIRGAPVAINGVQGPFRFFNPLPFSGNYNIKEGYIEVGLPVLADSILGSLDLNGAVRHADYSTSGGVTTWKVGASWQLTDDLRLRGTVSQDVRAPNLQELFNPGLKTSGNVSYPGQGTLPTTTFLRGNPNLAPERARTLTVGAVYKPSWLPGLQASVDYYKIKVKDAIGFFSEERIISECFAGNAAQCAQLTVTGGTLVVNRGYVNLSQQTVAGIDFELSYKTDFAGGELSSRIIANHGLKNESVTPGSAPNVALGLPSAPKWGGLAQVDWKKGPFGLFVQERYLGPARQGVDKPWVDGIDIANGRIPAVFYTNLTAKYDLELGGGKQQVFLSVQNLFNRRIPFGAFGVSSSFASSYNAAYDVIGRYFTGGVRVSF